MKILKVKTWYDISKNFTGVAEHINSKSKIWFKDGKRHRTDGPACEWSDGDRWWYQNGELHREDGGPAMESPKGIKKWFKNGKLHRTDGPAIEWSNENVQYYIHGIETYKEAVEVYHALFPKEDEQD